jgi:glucose-1-phosphate adenylyltransferase
MVTTTVDPADAGRYGVVQVTDGGRVSDYAYKPDEPAGNLVSNEVFVFSPATVLDTLDALADEAGDDGLEDLGTALLPRLVDGGGAREYRFRRYWRDVGTVDAYWSAHMDLLADDPPITLDDPAWPVRTRGHEAGPAWLAEGADMRASLASPGVRVAGSVERSVLAPGVRVEAGATVRDSVLLPGAVVRAGALVERVIADDGVEIGRDARVGGDADVTLVGRAYGVPAGARIPPGARVPDDDA